MRIKHWARSRTIWLNAVGVVTATIPAVADSLGVLQGVIPPHWYAYLLFGFTVANLVLRTRTKSAIGTGG